MGNGVKQAYTEHCEKVRKLAPEERFLEFGVAKDDWTNLATFLDKPVTSQTSTIRRALGRKVNFVIVSNSFTFDLIECADMDEAGRSKTCGMEVGNLGKHNWCSRHSLLGVEQTGCMIRQNVECRGVHISHIGQASFGPWNINSKIQTGRPSDTNRTSLNTCCEKTSMSRCASTRPR